MRMFAESLISIMKLHKSLSYFMAAALMFSCSQKLPSYSEFNPIQKPQDQEKEDPKEDDKTPAEPDLGYDVSPIGTDAFIDGDIVLEFKSAPTLGSTGLVKIYSSDGTEVDMIDMADVAATSVKMVDTTPFTTCHNMIGAKSQDRKRIINYKPVSVEGNKIIIKPHSNRLEYDKTYYITIDATAFTADGFKGVNANEWLFKTAKAPTSKSEVTVARSGAADFRTIQAAIDWAYTCGGNNAMTINIRNGIYQEQLFARNNNKITFKGESKLSIPSAKDTGVVVSVSKDEPSTSKNKRTAKNIV